MITSDRKNKVFKTNPISCKKENYLLTLNMNYELPSGLIKVNEMNPAYELK